MRISGFRKVLSLSVEEGAGVMANASVLLLLGGFMVCMTLNT